MGWGGFASLDLLARGVGTKFSMQIYYSCITYLHTKYSTMQWIYMYGSAVEPRRESDQYSLTSENVTKIKRYSAQILSYKIFSFCEQILKIGANDASGQGLQYAL
jgi:1,4-dihydroxy-2-naphthoyl-CoA synthase